MAHSTLERGGRVLLAAALAGAGLAAAIVTQSGGAATQDTTTTTTTTTAATTTTATTTASAPANASPPTISGTPSSGSTLTASAGSWTGTATIAFAYQWQRCDATGGSCSAIGGATAQTYKLGSADVGNTVRIVVTATNGAGSSSSTSAPSAVVAAAATTTTTATASNGCPTAAKGQVVPVSQVAAPARLQISGFQSNPGRLSASTSSFTLKVVVGDGCGHPVQGALVYATAVPFSQFDVPAEQATGADGSTTLTFARGPAYPASRRQELLALFLRARKPGDATLGGISTRQLVSVPVSLR
jgi:hypothetical protein